jgi:hypothetical protein
LISDKIKCSPSSKIRESTFIMPRGGGGGKMLRGAPKYFLALKGGALKVLNILKGGGYKRFKVLVQQGPGVFTPTVVNIIDGLETH